MILIENWVWFWRAEGWNWFTTVAKGKVGVDLLTTFTHWEQGEGGVLGYSDFGQ